MISCIDDDPEKRPSISVIVTIVKKLYEILLEAADDLNNESNNSLY